MATTSAFNIKKLLFSPAVSIIFLLVMLVLHANNAVAEEQIATKKRAKEQISPFIYYSVVFYQKHISRADGDRCSMHPTCSTYCLNAIKKHGFFVGWMMTCDRLLRCGRDELQLSGSVRINGKRRCQDPVGNNDFWWPHK